ncbi:MAG: twin-arginine translocase TatA/TatE family subunit [Alphaproteobacteria bacterium]
MGLSLGHLLLLAFIVLILFGTKRLPQIMRDLAEGFKAFKEGLDKDKE